MNENRPSEKGKSGRLPLPPEGEKGKNNRLALLDQMALYEDIVRVWNDFVSKKPGGNTNSTCLHLKCPDCNGTGYKKAGGGLCFHMLSCPCPRCTPVCM